jgi:hypothetical protein
MKTLRTLGGFRRQILSYGGAGDDKWFTQRRKNGEQPGQILISKTWLRPVKTARQIFFSKLKSRRVRDI